MSIFWASSTFKEIPDTDGPDASWNLLSRYSRIIIELVPSFGPLYLDLTLLRISVCGVNYHRLRSMICTLNSPQEDRKFWGGNFTPQCLKEEDQLVKKKKNVRSPWNMFSDVPEAPG
jgi:hypothetical protein